MFKLSNHKSKHVRDVFYRMMQMTGIERSELDKILSKSDNLSDSNDSDVYEKLRKLSIKQKSYNKNTNARRAERFWGNIRHYLHNDSIKSYLDFGGGAGDMAEWIGRELGIDKANIYNRDNTDWGSVHYEPNSNVTHAKWDEIKDNSIDLITASHVLHHLSPKELHKTLEEFKRVLSQSGIIVLYEHDVKTQVFADLVNLEHFIYAMMEDSPWEEAIKYSRGRYKSNKQWVKLMNSHLNVDLVKIISTKKLDRSAYLIFTNRK